MGTPAAVVIGAVLIAAALLLTTHYEVVIPAGGSAPVVRLNRWTGEVDMCAMDAKSANGNSAAGSQLTCGHQ
jgi:hypothetical protein